MMTDLRIEATMYRLLPDRYREDRKLLPEATAPIQGVSTGQPVDRTPTGEGPSIDPLLAFPRQEVSPALAASIYQANIPTEIYTYPYHGIPEDHDDTADDIENARDGQGHATVTMVQYEPGTLVDLHV